MTIHIILILASLLLLFIGAQALVRGSSSLAIRAGISALVVGLTVVAFGTSSPELVVSLKAALSGHGDIAVGNVVGSNCLNIGIILGLTALMCPIRAHRQVLKFDAPVALGTAVLLTLLIADGRLGRMDGAFLFTGIVCYTGLNVFLARSSTQKPDVCESEPSTSSTTRHWSLDIALILGGFGLLVLGSNLLVDNSVSVAKALGVSEAVIGLTIIAAGTSMPELATSLVAAFRKQPDIALGNVIGSNVFNVLCILGLSGLCAPLSAPGIAMTDYAFMIAFSVLLLPLLYARRKLHRFEGVVLLGLYGIYLWMLWPKH